jgi:hypothetical protein
MPILQGLKKSTSQIAERIRSIRCVLTWLNFWKYPLYVAPGCDTASRETIHA